MKVYDKARELVEVLKQEETYAEFVRWQRQVFTDPRLKAMLLELRTQEFNLHRRQLLGEEVSAEQKEAVRRLYELARNEPTLASYLDAEYQFSRMILEIQRIINEAVPVKAHGTS